MSIVTSAIAKIGLTPIARRHKIYPSAVQKWRDDGRLPRTEIEGLTNYSKTIEELSDREYLAADLIAATRESWKKKYRGMRK